MQQSVLTSTLIKPVLKNYSVAATRGESLQFRYSALAYLGMGMSR
jgi:hypothetical protein